MVVEAARKKWCGVGEWAQQPRFRVCVFACLRGLFSRGVIFRSSYTRITSHQPRANICDIMFNVLH